jgi:ankyrin repeat protein
VAVLLAKNAIVNAADNRGFTPLHFTKNKEMAQLLLADKAKIPTGNDMGTTSLHMASQSGSKAVAERCCHAEPMLMRGDIRDGRHIRRLLGKS